MQVSIIGSGNLAWHLAVELESAGVNITEIYSRTPKNAAELTEYLYETEPVDSLDFRYSQSQIFLIAVSDDAIKTIASQILLPPKAILAHTSGAKNLDIIDVAKENNVCYTGVFYPLMTFTKGKRVLFDQIPICIESDDETAEKELSLLANLISEKVLIISSYERLCLHVSAVFACNFTNHLWALSKEIIDSEELDFELLKPLIRETYLKAMAADHPAHVQTGPAIRNDQETIGKHLAFLADDDDLIKVYCTINSSIIDWNKIEK